MSITIKKWIALCVFCLFGYIVYWGFNLFFVYSSDAYTDNNVVSVSSQITGTVVNVYVHNGQMVKKNDLLFQIDPKPYLYIVQEKQAALKSAQVAYQVILKNIEYAEQSLSISKLNEKQAVKTYEKQKNLSSNVLSEQTVKDLLFDLDLAKANTESSVRNLNSIKSQLSADGSYPPLQEAKVALKAAEYSLSLTEVRASEDGTVENMHLYKGNYVAAGSTVFALVPNNTPWVTVRLKEQYLSLVKPGDKVTVYLYTGQGFLEGRVRSVNFAVNRRQASSSVATSPLPYLEQTEDWIELAQRFPISIELINTSGIKVPIGASAIVLVHRS